MQLYLGIDLACKAPHQASLVRSDGQVMWTGRRFTSRAVQLLAVWGGVVAAGGGPGGLPVVVVMEPTGNAWVPVKAWLRVRGARVVLVPTTQSAALRDYYKRYAKNDRLDSMVLARLPLHHGSELGEHVGDGPGDPLRRLVRLRAGTVKKVTVSEQRIDAHLQLLGPCWAEALGTSLGAAALRLLTAGYADPARLLRLGPARLGALLSKASRGRWRQEKAAELMTAARESLALWDNGAGGYGLDFAALATDIATEAGNVVHHRAQLADLEARMGPLAQAADPGQVIASVPGVGPVLRAVLAARLGDIGRFHSLGAVRAFTGLVPKESSSGTVVHQHGLTKAGDPLLREALFRAADGARKIDPQLAATYQRLIHSGRHHNSALCHIATRLVTRLASCMASHQQYVIRDLAGAPVTRQEGKHLVATRYQVDPAIRAANKTKRQAQNLKGRTATTPRPATSRVSQESQGAPTTRPVNHHDKALAMT